MVAADRTGVVFEHHFGFADLGAGIPVRPHHRFEIGSISKIFTSTVILRLVREGRLRFDQPIGEVLPWAPAALHGRAITIERLLTHTAGLLQSVDALPDEVGQVASFAGTVSDASPGTFFHYSNLGFILLGLAAARVTDRTMPDLVRERILEPLGMRDTVSAVTHDHHARLARGYQPLRDDRPWIPGDPLIPAPWLEVAGSDGSVAGTSRDLARFGRMLLSRGAAGSGTPVIDPESFEAMISRVAPEGEETLVLPGVEPSESSAYGFGVNVERTAGRSVLTHGGGMVGYASFLLADLTAGVTVAVVTNANGDGPVAEAIARSVAAQLIAPVAGAAGGTPDPQRWIVAAGAGSLDPDARLGVFEAAGPTGVPLRIEVAVAEQRAETATLKIISGSETSPLLWNWNGRALTRLSSLRRFPLTFDGSQWLWGPRVYRRVDESSAHPAPSGDASDSPTGDAERERLRTFCGHYRTYSPWFTNFRIVLRGGALVLIASGGVEAPGDDVELVELASGTFRLGADPRLPERITFAPPVDGLSPWADRDGCRYSRSFTG